MNLMKKILAVQAAVFLVWVGSVQANTDEAIAQRLKPVGDVCVQGEDCAAAASAGAATGAAASSSSRSGDEIIAKSCNVCHGTGLLDAPKVGDSADWTARSEAVGGLDGLLATSIAGKGAMPPMGTCSDCTDDELMDAIKVMSGL